MDISIRNKLQLAFGTVALLTTIMGIVAVTINLRIEADMSQLKQTSTTNAESVSALAESLLELKLYTEEILLGRQIMTPTDTQNTSDARQGIADSIQEFDQARVSTRMDTQKAMDLARHESDLDQVHRTEAELALVDKIDTSFGLLKRAISSYLDDPDRGITKEGYSAHKALWDDFNNVSVPVESYEADTKNQLGDEVQTLKRVLHHTNIVLVSVAVLVLIIGSFLAWFISRTVSQPISMLNNFAQRIGRGDLNATIKLQSRDEFSLLAGTFNQMTRDLRSKTVSKDYVDSILKSMVNTLVVVRPDHTIESINQAALLLLDYSETEIIGQPMDRVLKTSHIRSQSVLDEALEKEFISNVDVIYQAKDARLIPMAFSASILRDSTGTVSGLVCVAEDVSERKQSERELEQVNKQLVETSRQAGMAEVATSVLHNVGNVLNSVNVSSALISDRVQNSKVANFTKAVALMEEHQRDLPAFFTNDEKGRKLPGYLSKLAVNLAHEQKEILQEVASLAGNILHIKEIVATQQNYARVSGIAESLQIADLVEDALRINAGALERHGVTVVREYSKVPSVIVEKHKALQVLVNLIGNAKHACTESGKELKQMTLRVIRDGPRIKISVIDTGIGISEENLTRIFAYGFTTKKDGHGFGLHSSALSANEMRGTLTVYSEGPGLGAMFTLELPLPPEK